MQEHNHGIAINTDKRIHVFKLSCNVTKESVEEIREDLTRQIDKGLLLSSRVSYEGSFIK